ncbi:MAG: hypothetical protein Q7R30_09100 [Acidobacteriota bacterium]|nr:hypothetical protein [Acidobacteriota bacterium]
MPVNPDFSDLFSALNDAEARYLMVGGYAVSFHAEPRFTKDLDIWVDPAPPNAAAVSVALTTFGAPMSAVGIGDLSKPGMVIQIGIPPNRIDIVTSIDGVEFDEAWSARVDTAYGTVPIHVIGRAHLILNKRACGRPQDLVDADRLARDP